MGDSPTLSDVDCAHIAYSWLLNEANHLYKEQQEMIAKEEFSEIRAYFIGLRDDVFKAYFHESEYRVGKSYLY